MSRPLRIEYEGAWYHVMNRGIARQAIYLTIEHRKMFLNLLEEISIKYFIEIHAYCLMENHYHLLVRTPLANLGRAMRHLDGVYTRRFNISEERDGSIFRGRYHAILIEEEEYLLQVSRYIHLNPISAKLCANPSDYPWSSYCYYVNEDVSYLWLKTNEILYFFSEDKFKKYEEYVLEGIDKKIEDFYQKNFKLILGNKEFVTDKLKNLTDSQRIFSQSSVNRLKTLLKTETIINVIKDYFNVEISQLKSSKQGRKNIPRIVAIFIVKYYGQLTHQEIANYFTSIRSNSISTTIKRFETFCKDDNESRTHIGNIIRLLLDIVD